VVRLPLVTILSYTILSAQIIPDPVRPPMPETLFLQVQRPDSDTIKVFSSKYRLAACTRPEAKAFINGKQTKVYQSGAFVGLAELKPGTTTLRFTVKSQSGDSLWKEFVVVRPEPMKNSPHDTLVIEDAFMQPSDDMWLTTGDVLEVKFKGSPGWKASFDIPEVESGIPMHEVTPKEGGGFAGIYVGRYKINSVNEVRDVPIIFRLKKSFWSSEKVESKAKISILTKELPRVAEIVGKRPFLNTGLGEDRLGGAKLGFLQPGVIVEITGKVDALYRVRLSGELDGWLPEENAKLLPPNTPLPHSLAGAITASGNGTEDVVTLSLSCKLPFTSEQLINPTAITVDVYGATSNTNWIALPPSIKGIENITWKQVAVDHYRMIITLRYRQHWGYDIDYTGSLLRIKIRRPPTIPSVDSVLTGLTIAVDAGHGGENQGAIGATGALEKDATMSMARHLESILLSKGANVILTRTETSGPAMVDRIDKILNSRAQILVSIHCNSAGDASDPLVIQGMSTYYRSIGFKPLASILNDKLLNLGLMQFGVMGSFNFLLNSLTQIPNALIETAFISNPEDEMLLLDDGFRKRVAEQITSGLEEFLKKTREPAGN